MAFVTDSDLSANAITRFLVALFTCAAIALTGGDLRATAQDQQAGAASRAQQPAGAPDEDPDLPAFLRGRIDKAEYLRLRAEYISEMRGLHDDPLHHRRSQALQQMEAQLRTERGDQVAPTANNAVWTAIGPAPIPNGQTTGRSDPVSGRTISIAVDPTNPDIVYAGTAQGGLYRSVNGGTTWIPLMDRADSLVIGAIAIAPSNPNIVYVGTGEAGFSADSYFGVGLYRIDNARTTAGLTGPINPLVTTGIAGTTAFTGRAISEILVHPSDAATIFVATASGTSSNPSNGSFASIPPVAVRGVYRSTDATSAAPTFTKLSVPTAGLLVAGQPASADRDVTDLAMEPGNPNVILAYVMGEAAAGFGGVFRTTSALAATPVFAHTFQTSVDFTRGEFAVNKIGAITNVVIATAENAGNVPAGSGAALCTTNQGIIRTSADGGQTFSAKRPGGGGFCGGQCSYDIAVDIHPTNASIILLGGSSTAVCSSDYMRSVDGAATNFTRPNTGLHADTHAIAMAPSDPNIVYLGSDGGIWRSTDAGLTWASLNNTGFSATQFQDLALHPTDREFMIGGTQDNGTQFKQANGVWKRADFGDGGHALIDQSAADTTTVTMYHTYFNVSGSVIGFGRTRTTACANDGQWAFRAAPTFAFNPAVVCPGSGEPGEAGNGLIGTDAVLFYAPMALGPSLGPGTPNAFYFGTDKLYRDASTRGDAMVPVSQDFGGSGQVITSIGIGRPSDVVRIVGLRNGQVFATTTGANPLTDVTAPGFPDPHAGSGGRRVVSEAIIDPNNNNIAYVAFGGYVVPAGEHVWRTVNLAGGAATWVRAGDGIPDVPVNALVIDPANSSIIYAGTDIGVYKSINGGAAWTPFSDGMPRVAVFDLEIQNPHRVLRAVTHGRGAFEILLAAGPATAPGISDLPDRITNEDTATSTDFVVGSSAGNPAALVIAATSGNTTLVPNANLVITGAGTARNIAITPAPNQNGVAEITVTATQGAFSNSDSFFFTVNPINDGPTISDIANRSTPIGTSTGPVAFTVGDVDTAVGTLTLSGGSSNLTLVPNANITFGGALADRTVTVVPAAGQSGTSTITVTVSDGVLTASDTFLLTVGGTPTNPTVTVTSHAASSSATSPFVTLAGTSAPAPDAPLAAGLVSTVTWASNRGPSGTATGTTNWSAEIPLFAGANVITVTVTDVGGASGATAVTFNVAAFVYFFAEGATGPFFDLELGIANPNTTAAQVDILYLKDDGTTVPQTLTVGAQRRETILVDSLAGLGDTAVSAVVTSTNALPLGVERTMRWDATGYGAHTEKAVSGARLNWFFAEGSQGFFDTFILLANPQTTASVATVTFLRESGGPVTKTYNLLPTSRTNVYAGSVPELANASFGVSIAFSQPGVAERAMYFGTPLFNGGHESAGVNDPSTSWFLAEGAVGDFFDTFVLVANPNAAAATVTFTFLRDIGAPVVRTQTLAGNARLTMHVDTVFPGVTNGAVATQVTADQPVVVERAMYWPGAFSSWYEAHNAFGVAGTARRWALGEGRKGGPAQYETYILLANPGATPATVTITYLREGSNGPAVKTYTVPATSRFNVAVNSDVPEIAAGERFGALIDSTVPIAVERAMYSNAGGVTWAAGTNATATRIPTTQTAPASFPDLSGIWSATGGSGSGCDAWHSNFQLTITQTGGQLAGTIRPGSGYPELAISGTVSTTGVVHISAPYTQPYQPYDLDGTVNSLTSPTSMSVTIRYTGGGLYRCDKTVTKQSINQPPTKGSMLVSPTGIGLAAATIMTFTAQGISDPNGDPIFYIWDFGDGTTAPVGFGFPVVTHTYASPGVYKVNLDVNDQKAPDVIGAAQATVTVGTVTGVWDVSCERTTYAINSCSNFPTQFVATLTQSGSSVLGSLTGGGKTRNFTFPGTVRDPRRVTFGVESVDNVFCGPSFDNDFYFTMAADSTVTTMSSTTSNQYCTSSTATKR